MSSFVLPVDHIDVRICHIIPCLDKPCRSSQTWRLHRLLSCGSHGTYVDHTGGCPIFLGETNISADMLPTLKAKVERARFPNVCLEDDRLVGNSKAISFAIERISGKWNISVTCSTPIPIKELTRRAEFLFLALYCPLEVCPWERIKLHADAWWKE